jgi:uncharacterized protein involved in outer membrane biogenesis
VALERLEVHPGRVTAITLYGVKVANPAGFDGPDFATASRLSFKFEAETWWRSRQILLPVVEIDQPTLNLVRNDAGQANWDFSGESQKPVKIDDIEIKGGVAHLLDQPEQADMILNISATNGDTPTIDGTGTYARQPITLHAVGGPLRSLQDATSPYPIDLEVTNGETRITLRGNVRDPLAVGGADLALGLSGPDMALLLPLTGIAIPPTPPYRISGQLNFNEGRFDFTNITGEVGNSDLNGELHLDPTGTQPVLTGALMSGKVDLKDLGGFIGATPGHTAAPREKEAKPTEANPKLLPGATISMPKVLSADVHLTYRGDKIVGENLPFDTIAITLDIASGHIRLAPLRIGIGSGAIGGTVDLTPADDQMDANADMTISNVNIARLLATAGLGNGAGSIDGTAQLKGRGYIAGEHSRTRRRRVSGRDAHGGRHQCTSDRSHGRRVRACLFHFVRGFEERAYTLYGCGFRAQARCFGEPRPGGGHHRPHHYGRRTHRFGEGSDGYNSARRPEILYHSDVGDANSDFGFVQEPSRWH